MSEVELGNTTKELLRSARADGPSAAARAKIWSGVAAGTGAAAGAAGTAGAKAGALASTGGAAKIGMLFGGIVTVGLATAVLTLGAPPSLRPTETVAAEDLGPPIAAIEAPASPVATELTPRVGAPTAFGASSPTNSPSDSLGSTAKAAAPHAARAEEDPLLRESALVAEARGALVRGEPQAALAKLQATHALRPRAMEPEELSLEARALRALGRESDAISAEMQLKTRYPEHALAR